MPRLVLGLLLAGVLMLASTCGKRPVPVVVVDEFQPLVLDEDEMSDRPFCVEQSPHPDACTDVKTVRRFVIGLHRVEP